MQEPAAPTPVADFAQLRRMMVDCQVRTFDVTDQRVLASMMATPRELFVGPSNASIAYSDGPLTVRGGTSARTLLEPMVLARLLQNADLTPSSRVLDVAGATGYSAALLSPLAASVTTLDSDAAFTQSAKVTLSKLGLGNVNAVTGPIEAGYSSAAPYDLILVNGAVEVGLDALLSQLAPGGRLLSVLRQPGQTGRAAKAVRYERIGGETSMRALFDAAARTLDAFARAPVFVF